MNKVISINLNGRAYQLEEKGYELLREYLEKAEAKLHDNPDKDELMADFEQAIADKCDEHLQGHKNVISTGQIESIIAKMGPVDATGGADAPKSAPSSEPSAAPKRLYQVRQGSWIAGVCNGLALYFGVDVTVIRVLFILLGFFTHGFWIGAYIILAIVMPVARTEDELAAARGTRPFNAHDFIEQAKSRYADFQKEFGNMPPQPEKPGPDGDRAAWQKWKEDMKNWKQEWKADMRRERQARHEAHRNEGHHGWQNRPWQNRPWQDNSPMSGGNGFVRFIMGLVITALTVLWIIAILSVVTRGTIFGYALIGGHPLWVILLFLAALYYMLVLPFKVLARNARPWKSGHYSFFNDLVQSIFFVFAIYLVIVIGRELFPVMNEAWTMVAGYLTGLR